VSGSGTMRWRTTHGDKVTVYEASCPHCSTDHLEYRFRVQAANGEIVATGSEGYTRKAAAITAAERHHPRVTEETS